MEKKTLAGKKILITGAALRIGRSLALACADAGADIIVHYHTSSNAAHQLKEDIENLGRNCHLYQADLNNLPDVENLISNVKQDGDIYGLINNASIFKPASWDRTTLTDWQNNLNINLTAPFLLTQKFALSLPGSSHGRVINILDWRALRPGSDYFPYTISKAALAALTRSFAIALAPNICVNGVALGAILPPSHQEKSNEDLTNTIVTSIPHNRWGKTEEITETILFLLSGPSYITGEIIHIDGGRHLV